MKNRQIVWESISLIFIYSFFGFILFFNLISQDEHYWYLAKSFLHGKIFFVEIPNYLGDTVYFNNHYYWPLGPFPAILMIPLAFISNSIPILIHQGFLHFLFTLVTFWLSFKIAKKFNYTNSDAKTLAFAFCFASVYLFIAFFSWSSSFAQAITVTLLFLSIYEFLGKKRYLLIGLMFAAIVTTRFTAAFGILFFILWIIRNKSYSLNQKIRKISLLLTPIILAGILLLIYNYARFGDIFDNGYMSASNNIMTKEQRFEQLRYGLFKLTNIPTNFYYYFIKSLDPVLIDVKSAYGNSYVLVFPYIQVSYPGTSFFIISPVFLYIFRTNLKEKMVRLSLIPIFIILFILLTYYWPGWKQLGPRYLLDLLPFVFILLLYSFKENKLTPFSKIVIYLSSLLNFYLFIYMFWQK